MSGEQHAPSDDTENIPRRTCPRPRNIPHSTGNYLHVKPIMTNPTRTSPHNGRLFQQALQNARTAVAFAFDSFIYYFFPTCVNKNVCSICYESTLVNNAISIFG
ncbi:hypothetical protein CEXT_673541 [Caerostris extrusa]|uniref:Uncharacterized protein n=1 Tax=Caerostris extrusa TaxID=172846 RepID=A0AAV4XTZ6_CAEEX|nr:hypothetical protein CEXT_673541 [Caerostris extrusa]